MLNFHRCKTTTTKEYDPSTHSDYKNTLHLLRRSQSSLPSARYQLLNRESCLKKTVYEEEFHLPMQRNIFGLFTVQVYVNGIRCTFIVDTGAQISGIKHSLMEKLRIPFTEGGIDIGSVSGMQKKLKGVCIQKFRFGEILYEHLPMLCLDKDDFSLKMGEIDLFSFDGILGWDILSELDFEMDDIGKQFKVMKNKFRFSYQNMVGTSFPVFIVKDQMDQLLMYGFDSGSKRSWINIEAAISYGYQLSGEMQAVGFGVHGLEKLDLQIIKEVELSLFKANIKLKDIMSGNCNIDPALPYDGVLGNEIFRNRRIRIINSKGIVLLV